MSTYALSIRADLLGVRCRDPALSGECPIGGEGASSTRRVSRPPPDRGPVPDRRRWREGVASRSIGTAAAAARSTGAWHTHVDSARSRREGPNGPDEGGEPCQSGGS